jgi:hypothetical protein
MSVRPIVSFAQRFDLVICHVRQSARSGVERRGVVFGGGGLRT